MVRKPKRNYAAERARRNERARSLGYTSHDAMTRARRKGTPTLRDVEQQQARIPSKNVQRARNLGFPSYAAYLRDRREFIQREYEQALRNNREPDGWGAWSPAKKFKWAVAHADAVASIKLYRGDWKNLWHTLYFNIESGGMTDAEFRNRYKSSD